MSLSIGYVLAAVLLGSVAQDDPVSYEQIRDTTAAIRRAAFDPAAYFPSPYVNDLSIVRITYTGDDYGWPIHAIAIAEGCIDDEDRNFGLCRSRLRARMVRAPAIPEPGRPRDVGAHLVGRVIERAAVSPQDIEEALNDIGPEWLEADLRDCPEAMEALARSQNADWVPDGVAMPVEGDEIISAHADIVRVEIQQNMRLSYEGSLSAGSPAVWAQSLASALESCWRPAEVPAPWRIARAVE